MPTVSGLSAGECKRSLVEGGRNSRAAGKTRAIVPKTEMHAESGRESAMQLKEQVIGGMRRGLEPGSPEMF